MVAAIIQARMGSTRLPGKVLSEIGGAPMLEYQIRRVKEAKLIDKVIVATSMSPQDDVIVSFCRLKKITCCRGSESDVLSRYYDVAREYEVDIIVRLTADCPLIDPTVIDRTIDLFHQSSCDYVANTVPPETSRFPDGSDVEVFSMQALECANMEAESEEDREHVTFYFWKSRQGYQFRTSQLSHTEDWSEYRFTVDYPEDFEAVTRIIAILDERKQFGYLDEIIQILKDYPDIYELNSKYYFGIGWD